MRKKKALFIVLFLINCILWQGVSAFAEEPDSEDIPMFGLGYVEDENDIDGNLDIHELPTYEALNYETLDMEAPLPTKFDPRDGSCGYLLPPVRNQGSYGTCWAHAGIACMEISLLKQGLVTDPAAINLSELQAVYYSYYFKEDWKDPKGGLLGDAYWYHKTTMNFLNRGGNQNMFTKVMMDWKAGAQEASDNYLRYTECNVALTDVQDNHPVFYTQDRAFNNQYAQLDQYQKLSGASIEELKQAILDYGALSVSYFAATESTNPELYAKYYNSATYGYYCYEYQNTNHGVAIIGWDDTFPKENFGLVKPERDGAWIVRNSWGAGTEDGGYFYLSYEDKSLLSNVYVYKATLTPYQHNYQYDGTTGATFYHPVTAVANVFTISEHAEKLKAVSVELFSSNVPLKISVYKNVLPDNPQSGQLCLEQEYLTDRAGFYRIPLDTEVSLNEGDTFSVVIECTDGSTANFGVDNKSTQNETMIVGYSTHSYGQEEGQSFYYSSGNWRDSYSVASISNFHVKAYTVDASPQTIVPVESVALDKSSLDLKVNQTATLIGTILPANATYSTMLWESSDVTTVSVSSTGQLKGLKAGTAQITLWDYKKTKSAVCTVTVSEPTIEVTDVVLNGVDTLTLGSTATFSATVHPSSATNKTVTWTSSDTSVIKVDNSGKLSAIGVGTARITAKAGNVSKFLDVKVVPILPTRVTMSGKQTSVVIGEGFELSATVFPDNTTDKRVTWSSSNPSVATISSDGKVSSVGVGKTTLKVTIQDCEDSYELEVRPILASSVVISPATNLKLEIGEKASFEAWVEPSNATDKSLVWSSDDEAIATVKEGEIEAISLGTTYITVKAASGANRTIQVEVVNTPEHQVRQFAERLYSLVLGRKGDPAGIEDWSNRLLKKEITGSAAAYGFFFSPEMKKRNVSNEEYVKICYRTMLNREADEAGLAGWVENLNNGMSRQYVLYGFTNSREYGKICNSYGITQGDLHSNEKRDQNPGVTAFVARCYTKALGRDYDPSGLNYWCDKILSATNKRTMAESVASNGFFHSKEFVNKKTSNEEYVKILYRTFLGREYDEAGLADWVGKLNSGVSRDQVLYGFSRSKEFAKIMASYGL